MPIGHLIFNQASFAGSVGTSVAAVAATYTEGGSPNWAVSGAAATLDGSGGLDMVAGAQITPNIHCPGDGNYDLSVSLHFPDNSAIYYQGCRGSDGYYQFNCNSYYNTIELTRTSAAGGTTSLHTYTVLAGFRGDHAFLMRFRRSAGVGTVEMLIDGVSLGSPVSDSFPPSTTTSPLPVAGAVYDTTGGAKVASVSVGLPAATTVTLTGASTSTVGSASGNLIATLDQKAGAGGQAVMIASSVGGDILTPASPLTIADGSLVGTFTVTASTLGDRDITVAGTGLTPAGSPKVLTASGTSTSGIWRTTIAGLAPGLVGGTTAGFGYKVSVNLGAYGSLVTSGIVERSPGTYGAQFVVDPTLIPDVRWFDGSGGDFTDGRPVAVPAAAFPVQSPPNWLNRAAFADDTKFDGAMRAASGPATLHLDPADVDADARASGIVNEYLYIGAGAGRGQSIPVASIADGSGGKDAAIQPGYTLLTPLDTTSKYSWTGTPVLSLPMMTVVSGSGSSLVVTGYPAGKVWDGQHLCHVASGEIKAIASHTYSSPNYTLAIVGAFSSVAAGDAVCLLS
jgi:hypothetical protein